MTLAHDNTLDAQGIRRAQEGLNALGYRPDDGRTLEVDGELGPRTRSAALKFQSERMSDPPTDGNIGPRTMMALAWYADYLDSLESDRHPCHAMYGQAMRGVQGLPPPCPRDDPTRSANIAAAITVAAKRGGLDEIDHVIPSENGQRIFAVQGDVDSPLKRVVEVDLAQAMETPAESSNRTLAAHAGESLASVSRPQENHRAPML